MHGRLGGFRKRKLVIATHGDASRLYRLQPERTRTHHTHTLLPLPLLFLTMAIRVQTSAAGILALLSDPEPALKQHALQALLPLVPQFWAEISEHVAYMYASSLNSFD